MKRYAAHYIFLYPETVFKNYYIGLDKEGFITEISPLSKEIAYTSFYNGIIFPVDAGIIIDPKTFINDLNHLQILNNDKNVFELLNQALKTIYQSITNKNAEYNYISLQLPDTKYPVCLYQLDGINLPASKLCTDDGSCNGYIQRL